MSPSAISGIGLVNLVNLFDPEVMVIGGGLSQIGEPMFRALREALSANRFHPTPTNTRLCAAQLGTKAGVIGAASLRCASFTALNEQKGGHPLSPSHDGSRDGPFLTSLDPSLQLRFAPTDLFPLETFNAACGSSKCRR